MEEFILFRPLTPNSEDILMAGTFKAYRPGRVELIPEMQHLACFAGGMFALGSKLFDNPSELETARKLVNGCIWAYNQTQTGIMPELFRVIPCPKDDDGCAWNESAWMSDMRRHNANDGLPRDYSSIKNARLHEQAERLGLSPGISAIERKGYDLRPEAIESIFVLYRITGDMELREIAWNMFESITKHGRTEHGFASIEDVTRTNTAKVDKMESFWIAETLKYFYLMFEDPGVLSLDDFVFNTEAHPFRLQ
jgi:mannosyl-oligosaccharide alpha-1,2-mannosidase